MPDLTIRDLKEANEALTRMLQQQVKDLSIRDALNLERSRRKINRALNESGYDAVVNHLIRQNGKESKKGAADWKIDASDDKAMVAFHKAHEELLDQPVEEAPEVQPVPLALIEKFNPNVRSLAALWFMVEDLEAGPNGGSAG